MDYTKKILHNLNDLKLSRPYKFEMAIVDDLQFDGQVSFISINKQTKRKLFFSFTKVNIKSVEINKFSCIIHRIVEAGSPSFYIEKYLFLEHQIDDKKAMSLNSYEGDFEQKLKSFFMFFEQLLNEPILSKVLAGEFWTDEYNYTMTELTGK